MSHYVIDIETAPVDPNDRDFAALQPWRLRQGKAYISDVSIHHPDGTIVEIKNDSCQPYSDSFIEKLGSELSKLQGQVVWAHNAVFDVAWLIAQFERNRTSPVPKIIRKIRWRCSMLLAKWVINGQLAEQLRVSLSLANLIQLWLRDLPGASEFIEMKKQGFKPGENAQYWAERASLDVIMTNELIKFLAPKLDTSQRIGADTEFRCIAPVANSWLVGFRIDIKALDYAEKYYTDRRKKLCQLAGIPEANIGSPAKLSAFVFGELGLQPRGFTDSGKPSTSADNLLWIEYDARNSGNTDGADRLKNLIEAKQCNTILSKYVKTTREALNHTGDGYIYAAPRIFGTYTGRFTYSNSVTSRDYSEDSKRSKYKFGLAFHQMPRKAKEIRQFIIPPPGMMIYEADAAGQESRLMALRSNDERMLKVFSDNLNFHSMTGSEICGMDYYDFEAARKIENDSGPLTEQRQLGKLTNLSCNYRIGAKSLAEKAFTKYDTFMTVDTSTFLIRTFNRSYPGVPQYWNDVVEESKRLGYTYAFGGRRFKITEWRDRRWESESSAINVPIQGAGASMKEIAIAETFDKCPEAIFCLDLHDANFFYVPESVAHENFKKLDEVLNNVDYSKYWGFTPCIPLPYDSKYGVNFSEVK